MISLAPVEDEFHSERENILAKITGYDPSYEVVHFDSWADYEESGWMFVLRKNGTYFSLTHMYSVYGQDDPEWLLSPISEDQALDMMVDWDARS